MPTNRNALIRYKTLDACLRNRFRRWTLDDLIDHVAEALYDYEGRDAGISRRTIQADLQMMRSDKLGYNAPIVVVEKKFYQYNDPDYSITQTPLSAQDLDRMNEAVEMLKQFRGFSHFDQLTGVVQRLEEHIRTKTTQQPSVIDFERNDHLRGLDWLDPLYRAVTARQPILLDYQSFRAKESRQFMFHGWWLKEFRNRWFVVGQRQDEEQIVNLALDRIRGIGAAPPEATYRPAPDDLTPATFYRDAIGVSVSPTMRVRTVQILVSPEHAPYVETKPLHPSQKLTERRDDGCVFELSVQLNFELEREILGFGEGMTVLAPAWLRRRIQARLAQAGRKYDGNDSGFTTQTQSERPDAGL